MDIEVNNVPESVPLSSVTQASNIVWAITLSSCPTSLRVNTNTGAEPFCPTADLATAFAAVEFTPSTAQLSDSGYYMDLNEDGRIDSLLYTSTFPFTTASFAANALAISIAGIAVPDSERSVVFETSNYAFRAVIKFPPVTAVGVNTSVPVTFQLTSTSVQLVVPSGFSSSIGADPASTNAVDAAPPVLVSAVGTSFSQAVTLTMSEPVGVSITSSNIQYSSPGAGTTVSSVSVASNVITLQMSQALSRFAFSPVGANPDQVSCNFGSSSVLYSLSTNVTLRNSDTTKPTLVSVTTGSSGNGPYLNRLVFVFSESILSSTFSLGSLTITKAQASVQSYSGLSIVDTVADDSTILVTFSVTCAGGFAVCYNTGEQPTVTLSGVQDINGNVMDPVSNRLAVDGAVPVLVWASASVGSSRLTAIFSEPVFGSGNTAVSLSSFSYWNRNGLTLSVAAFVASPPPGVSRYNLTLGGGSPTRESFLSATPDQLNASSVFDAAGNSLPSTVTLFGFLSALYNDTNTDSTVDTLVFNVSRPLALSLTSSASFSVATPTGISLGASATVAQGSEVRLSIASGAAGLGTRIPSFSFLYTEGHPSVSAQLLDSVTLLEMGSTSAIPFADRARPILLSAVGYAGENRLMLNFSEPIQDIPLDAADIHFVNGFIGKSVSIS